jgi:hypothetical protein
LSQTSQLSKIQSIRCKEKATTAVAHNRNKISVRQLRVNNCITDLIELPEVSNTVSSF